MFCEICRKNVVSRRHLFNIFRKEIHHICDYCYKKYPIMVHKSLIPMDGGEILWVSLLKTQDVISPLAHMSFYKPFIIEYMKAYSDNVLLIMDEIDEEQVTLFEKLKLGDIYLLTLYDKI